MVDGPGVRTLRYFYEYYTLDPFLFYSWILIITFSICLHEYAHAQVALWKGDDTAARMGHLTLNPLVQMGWMSLVLLAVVGIAWGAVPVDRRNLKGRSAMAQVAFAGPFANLILAVLFAVLFAVAYKAGLSPEVQRFLELGSMANGVLFLFNMLPFPMFDGWTVLSLFVPQMERIDARQLSGFSWIAILVIWTTGIFGFIWNAGSGIGEFVFRLTLSVLGG